MGRAKKLKVLRKVIKQQSPDVPFGTLKPYYKKMKKIIFPKGDTIHAAK